MSDKFVIDSCAMIAFLYGERGKDAVKAVLTGENEVYMHSVNVLEVYYDSIKRVGSGEAGLFLRWIFDESPIEVLYDTGEDIIIEAGYFKSKYKISLGDSFVLATSQLRKARIVSSDHHEFDIIEKSEEVDFLWIR
ncbi:hypothetical protein R80B4_02084 [Fibrobacteres bacterium R8-0-B4]